MSFEKKPVFIFSSAVSVQEETHVPAKIFHRGIGPEELMALKGCVRKSDPREFWHRSPLGDTISLESWVGQTVLFVAQDPTTRRELSSVPRTITACYEKPVAEVTVDELFGTIAELAMQQVGCTLQEFFDANEHFRGFTMAMVIRVD